MKTDLNSLRALIQPHMMDGRDIIDVPLPRGERGTAVTLATMSALSLDASRSPLIRGLAALIMERPPRRFGQSVQSIWDLAREYIRFRADPLHTERIRTPERMVAEAVTLGGTEGDCDDTATLCAALILCAGLRAGFAVAADSLTRWDHVYAVAFPSDGSGSVLTCDPQEQTPIHALTPARRTSVWRIPEVQEVK